MIILTPEEAAKVRGLSVPGHALDPIELEDGTFILPDEVLSDPHHAKHLATLKKAPKREIAETEMKAFNAEKAATRK